MLDRYISDRGPCSMVIKGIDMSIQLNDKLILSSEQVSLVATVLGFPHELRDKVIDDFDDVDDRDAAIYAMCGLTFIGALRGTPHTQVKDWTEEEIALFISFVASLISPISLEIEQVLQ